MEVEDPVQVVLDQKTSTDSKSVVGDASKIVWSHATNSQDALAKVLSPSSTVSFIEADIIQLSAESEPLMAFVY